MLTIPDRILDLIPALDPQRDIEVGELLLFVKILDPTHADPTAWYVAEYDPEEEIFFGWVADEDPDWGYFSLHSLRKRGGLDYDRTWPPIKASELPRYQEACAERARREVNAT